jgi:hypothetical protein
MATNDLLMALKMKVSKFPTQKDLQIYEDSPKCKEHNR